MVTDCGTVDAVDADCGGVALMADEVRHRAVLGCRYLLGQVVGAGHGSRGLVTIGGELGTGSAGESSLFTTGAALGGATEPQAVAASGSSAAIVRRLCTYRSVTRGAWTIKVSCASRAVVWAVPANGGVRHTTGDFRGCWSAGLGVGRVQVTDMDTDRA